MLVPSKYTSDGWLRSLKFAEVMSRTFTRSFKTVFEMLSGQLFDISKQTGGSCLPSTIHLIVCFSWYLMVKEFQLLELVTNTYLDQFASVGQDKSQRFEWLVIRVTQKSIFSVIWWLESSLWPDLHYVTWWLDLICLGCNDLCVIWES